VGDLDEMGLQFQQARQHQFRQFARQLSRATAATGSVMDTEQSVNVKVCPQHQEARQTEHAREHLRGEQGRGLPATNLDSAQEELENLIPVDRRRIGLA
jgi:hypothetical protein